MGFLLVGDPADTGSRMMIEQILAPLGGLQAVNSFDARDSFATGDFEAVLIDAGLVDDFARFVEWVGLEHPGVPVIVLGTLPGWTQARDAFRAGAIDYILKSPREDDLMAEIYRALKKPIPPSP